MAVENIELVPYDARWPEMFRQEAAWLYRKLGANVVLRVEHIGSTAVPGLSAKPVIDMLVEVPSFEVAKRAVVPVLQKEGWEYIWRDDRPPGHMMFIRRNAAGIRTHHAHAAPAGHSLWERLAFRDYLLSHPDEARCYEQLKRRLVNECGGDREAYTAGKSEYVRRVTAKALTKAK